MSFFCMLWTPLFLLFRLSLGERDGRDGSGAVAVWAFLPGLAAALIHHFAGNLVLPQGFGLSRWIFSLVDIIIIPVELPFLVALFLRLFRRGPSAREAPAIRVFVLAWIIPEGFFRVLAWGGGTNPLYLVLVPLLWSAVAEGTVFFAACFRRRNIPRVFCAAGMAILPLAASFSFWAFFGHRNIPGALGLAVSLVPAILSTAGAAAGTGRKKETASIP